MALNPEEIDLWTPTPWHTAEAVLREQQASLAKEVPVRLVAEHAAKQPEQTQTPGQGRQGQDKEVQGVKF